MPEPIIREHSVAIEPRQQSSSESGDPASQSQRLSAAGVEGVPGQGPFMLMVLQVHQERILDARFQTYGCPAAVSCGTFVAEWVTGKTLSEAENLQEEDILNNVGHMPLGREHCPGLAIKSLRHAVIQLKEKLCRC